nr:hypothetical protein [Pseudodonghicola xiamenensis]
MFDLISKTTQRHRIGGQFMTLFAKHRTVYLAGQDIARQFTGIVEPAFDPMCQNRTGMLWEHHPRDHCRAENADGNLLDSRHGHIETCARHLHQSEATECNRVPPEHENIAAGGTIEHADEQAQPAPKCNRHAQ